MNVQHMIVKYTIPRLHPDVYIVQMNYNAKVMCVQIQNGLPTVWALVPRFCIDDDRTLGSRIRVAWTGGFVGQHDRHLSTVQHTDGLVWHFFGVPRYD